MTGRLGETSAVHAGSLTRQYAKLCDLRDFEDPSVLAAVRSVLPERDPATHIERKVWEFAMLALFLEDVGALHDRTRVLSLGAGDERILFWLANRVGAVVATDIYGHGRFSGFEARPSMLVDPAAHAPFEYRRERLEVKWMDARALEFPDGSFDVVFSLSSIEHFGSKRDVARSARELARVLKPGGHAVVVTECLLRHDPIDAVLGAAMAALTFGQRIRTRGTIRRGALSEMFSPAELLSRIVRPSGLRLMQPLDLSLSARAWEHVCPASPSDWPSREAPYPMILMRAKRSVFTSVCLVMQRPLRP